MSCGFDQDLIQDFAIGEVSSVERSDVSRHLSTCAHCRAEVTALRQLARDLASLPEPPFPGDLEEILVRSSIQAGRAVRPEAVRPVVQPTLRPAWVLFLGGVVGVTILTLLIVLLWPGRGPAERMVGGGQGLGLLDGVLRWIQDLKSGWEAVREFMDRFAPVGKAVRVALGGVGGAIWGALALGAVGATLLLWRVTRVGQKKIRSLGDANPE